jgi:prepilin-type N-terminal cleavage/methylation domain-containing protein
MPAIRRGFTLVELLVVVTIIAVLMGLLLPAIQNARDAGRRTTCMANQAQVALALIRHDQTNGYIPGWKNRVTGMNFDVSWPFTTLPFIDRMDVYRQNVSGGSIANAPYISKFVCPANPPRDMAAPWLSFAGNVGGGAGFNSAGPLSVARALGVMLDTTITTSAGWNGNFRVESGRRSMSDIADGTSTTLLLADKCGRNFNDVGAWAGDLIRWSSAVDPGNSASWVRIAPHVFQPGTSGQRVINPPPNTSDGIANNIETLPSSLHPGGAAAAFCDGSTVFLRDTLEPWVYSQLLSSDTGRALSLITTGTAGTVTGTYYTLREADYK